MLAQSGFIGSFDPLSSMWSWNIDPDKTNLIPKEPTHASYIKNLKSFAFYRSHHVCTLT